MSDSELMDLARHAEMKAADGRTPPAEVALWSQISKEISDWLAEPVPATGPGLFDE